MFLFFQDVPTVRLCLRKPRSNKKVQWTQGTVDNEHMNKKKSKCKYLFHSIYHNVQNTNKK